MRHSRLGATPDGEGTTFVAFTTTARDVQVEVDGKREPMESRGDGWFARRLAGVGPGALYAFVLDGDRVPDPYARFLPEGVHGLARVEAPAHESALARPSEPWILYELHVGAFTPEGTYRGATEKLDALVELGVTAIELMPVAAFAGERGWGYDGVALYAPHAPYGTPEDLRALVRAAHARGLAVVLDVVYNHFGPAGNYLGRYSPAYFTEAVRTPWGAAPDFAHAPMRRLAVENARYWLDEFGFDGLRLDATHAIHDPSGKHLIAEICEVAHAMSPPRKIFCEDERNDPALVTAHRAEGVWADDFHHHVHVLLTGERDGYYATFPPTVEGLAGVINRGWTRGPHETRSLRPRNLVYCTQNHDQVGNRAAGTRLEHEVEEDAAVAAAALLLFLPATPLLFMGQEWSASSPFLYFSDHEGELGVAVSKGRREEFKDFASFAHAEVPDPQARATFERSKLRWDEVSAPPHARIRALYRAMIALRREDPVLSQDAPWDYLSARADGDLLVVTREGARRIVVNFAKDARTFDTAGWRVLFATEPFTGNVLAPRSALVLAR